MVVLYNVTTQGRRCEAFVCSLTTHVGAVRASQATDHLSWCCVYLADRLSVALLLLNRLVMTIVISSTCRLHVQVLSTCQVAEMMVHAYPFVNVHEALLDNSIKRNPFDKLCLMCGSDQTRKCGRCQSVHYCGSSCQKQDWPYHKNVCIC